MSITAMKDMANYIDALGGDSKKYRQAIEQAEKEEPVAWIYSQGAAKVASMNYVPGVRATPLYTTPPVQEFVCSTGLCHYKAQRQWVELTDDEFENAFQETYIMGDSDLKDFAKVIEARLKEKNT